MATAETSQVLNDLLIEVTRSLLQYAREAWPWTSTLHEDQRLLINRLAEKQAAGAAELVELLMSRGWSIDFGTYPTEYTDLHYVSLEYVLGLLLDNEQSLVTTIMTARDRCRGDQEAEAVLDRVLFEQREIVASLTAMRNPQTSGSAA